MLNIIFAKNGRQLDRNFCTIVFRGISLRVVLMKKRVLHSFILHGACFKKLIQWGEAA